MSALDTIQAILATVMADGLESGFRLFTGMYRAKVSDNKDPEHRGRIKVVMSDFGHETMTNAWITPVFGMAGEDRGAFYPPEIGDMVRVVFFAGDQSRPLAYFPGWYIDDALPAEFKHGDDDAPHVRGFVTRGGHSILMSDNPEDRFVQMLWHDPASGDASLSDPSKSADRTPGKGKMSWFRLTKDGGFQLALNGGEGSFSYLPKEGNPSGQFLLLDSYQNSIAMKDDGITITDTANNVIGMYDGEINIICGSAINITAKEVNFGSGGVSLGSPAVMHAVVGEILLAWLATHTHMSTGPLLPTGPPLPPPPPSILSKSVKVKT